MILAPQQVLGLYPSKKDEFVIFVASLFYTIWWFRNESCFSAKPSIEVVIGKVDMCAKDFLEEISLEASFDLIHEKWKPPPFGLWKVNCDTVVVGNSAPLALVVYDDNGFFVFAST